jgi:hypothetical protein
MNGKAKVRAASVLASRYVAPRASEPINLDEPLAVERIKLFCERERQRWLPNFLARVRAESRKILVAAGLPEEPGAVLVVEDGSERILIGAECAAFIGGLATIVERKGHEIGSKIWYAAKVLDQIACLDRARKDGNRDTIEHEAFHMGVLVKQADVDLTFGRELETGRKIHQRGPVTFKQANAKRSARATKEHLRWIAEAKEIWRRNPRLSHEACARLLIKHLGLKCSKDTVRKRIAGYKLRKVGNAS